MEVKPLYRIARFPGWFCGWNPRAVMTMENRSSPMPRAVMTMENRSSPMPRAVMTMENRSSPMPRGAKENPPTMPAGLWSCVPVVLWSILRAGVQPKSRVELLLLAVWYFLSISIRLHTLRRRLGAVDRLALGCEYLRCHHRIREILARSLGVVAGRLRSRRMLRTGETLPRQSHQRPTIRAPEVRWFPTWRNTSNDFPRVAPGTREPSCNRTTSGGARIVLPAPCWRVSRRGEGRYLSRYSRAICLRAVSAPRWKQAGQRVAEDIFPGPSGKRGFSTGATL